MDACYMPGVDMSFSAAPSAYLPQVTMPWVEEPTRPRADMSQFSVWKDRALDLMAPPEGLTALPKSARRYEVMPAEEATEGSRTRPAASSHISAAAQERITLLAASYVAKQQSAEVKARVEILGARILNAVPRVNEAEARFLEDAERRVRDIGAERRQLLESLGLPAGE